VENTRCLTCGRLQQPRPVSASAYVDRATHTRRQTTDIPCPSRVLPRFALTTV
jgi:hypothetical protein